MLTLAFTTPVPLSVAALGSVTRSTCPTVPTMRCRRDLKKEKSLRNLEFARAHRKRTVKRFNRRAAQAAVINEDNEFLSDIYDTIRFGEDNSKSGKTEPGSK